LLLAASDDGKEFIKIADFGLSKDFGEEALQTSCGTPDYVGNDFFLQIIIFPSFLMNFWIYFSFLMYFCVYFA
jgi:hypothetical protein